MHDHPPPENHPTHFLHIPKTAGTSVTEWLIRHIAHGTMCPAKNWDQTSRLAAIGTTDAIGDFLTSVAALHNLPPRNHTGYPPRQRGPHRPGKHDPGQYSP